MNYENDLQVRGDRYRGRAIALLKVIRSLRSGDEGTLRIEFDTDEQAKHFALWLCESGEQAYWRWMEDAELDHEGPITAVRFDYHHPYDDRYAETDERHYRGAKFLGDMTVRTRCGRLDTADK